MRLSELPFPAAAHVLGDPNRAVTGAALDSRAVQPDWLYAALPGANVHGAQFAAEVVRTGVRAILTDAAGLELIRTSVDEAECAQLSIIVVDNPRAVLGEISAAIYGTHSSHGPTVLGITGTNGKTTTTYIIDGLLRALGQRTGVIGTVAILIAGEPIPAVRTTPEAPELHALFARMRAASIDHCAMEVSSHALSQHRVDGARFAVAGFTNLSQDHLDYHGTMDAYFEAKAALFTPYFSDQGVVFLADEWAHTLATTATIPITTIGWAHESANADVLVEVVGAEGEFVLQLGTTDAGETQTIRAHSPLPGTFNIANTALALVMLVHAGFSVSQLAAIATTFEVQVAGRMEIVHNEAPRAVVDYSHTPDSISQALTGLKRADEQLIIVVGAGGNRDSGKRTAMGAAAAHGADVVIITDDNPRDEDPAAIRAAVLAGAQAEIAAGTARAKPEAVHEIASRAEAIAHAVKLAHGAGTILVAGKGHETGQEISGVIHHFDDREQTRKAIASTSGSATAGKVHS